MRKPITSLLLLAACAGTGVATAGCGADDVDPAAIAQAAEKTASADTAEVRMKVETKGFGLPLPLEIEGTGTTALAAPEMDLTLDFGSALALLGEGGGDGKVRVKVLGKDIVVDPPALKGFALPDGARWLALDLEETIEAMGIDARGLGEIMTLDPGAQLDVLRTAADVEERGEEKIDGADTTHYRGSVKIGDFIEQLPADRQASAREALKALEAQTDTADEAAPFDVWVDEQDRIRRMSQRVAVPGQEGVPGGEVAITMDLGGFGAEVDDTPPPRDETYDVTDDVTRALESGLPSQK